MFSNAISQITLNNLGDTMSQVTNVYMELEKLNKELIQEEETSKLYANLIVLTENQETAGSIAQSVPENITAMNETEEKVLALSQQTGSEELVKAFQTYNAELDKLEAISQEIADKFLAGDKAGAKAVNDGIYEAIQLLDEVKTAYTAVMDQELAAINSQVSQQLTTTTVVGILFLILYLTVAAFVIGMVIFTIAKPAKNASTELNDMITQIENKEGDLT